MKKFWPQTLLWQTLPLIVALMPLSVFVRYSIYRAYERELHACQLAQMVASVVNLIRSAPISTHPDKRQALLLELCANWLTIGKHRDSRRPVRASAHFTAFNFLFP